MANKADKQIRLENVRLSFPHLFKAHATNKDDKAAFSCHFIMEPDSNALTAVKAAMRDVAREMWGGKGEDQLKALIAQQRVCLRRGDEKVSADGEVLDGYAGNYFVSARGYVRPTVVDKDRSPLTETDGKPYSGCHVNGIVSIWAQTGEFGKRINAQLMGVQFVSDGEAFGGGGSAARPDDFDTLADEFGASDDDLTGGGDDLTF